MTFQEVKELHDMGFTPEQITQLNLGSEPEPNPDPQPEPNPDPQPEPNPDPQPEPNPDPVSERLQSMEQKINDFIQSMQKNNLKTASVNILPDEQIDSAADTALSELIRPTLKEDKNK